MSSCPKPPRAEFCREDDSSIMVIKPCKFPSNANSFLFLFMKDFFHATSIFPPPTLCTAQIFLDVCPSTGAWSTYRVYVLRENWLCVFQKESTAKGASARRWDFMPNFLLHAGFGMNGLPPVCVCCQNHWLHRFRHPAVSSRLLPCDHPLSLSPTLFLAFVQQMLV